MSCYRYYKYILIKILSSPYLIFSTNKMPESEKHIPDHTPEDASEKSNAENIASSRDEIEEMLQPKTQQGKLKELAIDLDLLHAILQDGINVAKELDEVIHSIGKAASNPKCESMAIRFLIARVNDILNMVRNNQCNEKIVNQEHLNDRGFIGEKLNKIEQDLESLKNS